MCSGVFRCFPQGIASPVIDTVEIQLSKAEDEFLKNNYQLLAEKYNVDSKKALIRQAGLLNNPNIYYENNIYNQYSKKYFPTALGTYGEPATQGEYVIQYNWLFSIAGKRNKSVKVASAQADVEQYQFDDLIRTLLFALRSDFYEISYSLRSLKMLNDEINSLAGVLSGFETQYQKGNISLREITRIRALLFSLQGERLGLITTLQQTQSEFSKLMNSSKTAWFKPVFNEADFETRYPSSKIVYADLISQALANRPDLKAAQASLNAAKANENLQKAVGVPDVMVQGVADRNGSYVPNYNGLAVSIPVAIFNRNQGNIKSAKFLTDAATQQLNQKQVGVQNDVFTTFQKLQETEKLYSSLSSNFSSDFNSLLQGAQSMFEKRNLTLIEFVDLFESYKESMLQFNSIKAQRYSAFEELIFNVGKDVFK
ncbi:MAG: TolC family protein [Bacteroidia bacterium]